uniref:Uncharacterized protein n=1 Tax=Coccidioides posadasii RMSCC 3488 TaxID=454284 RepID=A0A0J6F3D5_COCPO|nr:hypothetical protein CPAG_00965 [Coccidioides posadasii RMSCC 3488]
MPNLVPSPVTASCEALIAPLNLTKISSGQATSTFCSSRLFQGKQAKNPGQGRITKLGGENRDEYRGGTVAWRRPTTGGAGESLLFLKSHPVLTLKGNSPLATGRNLIAAPEKH